MENAEVELDRKTNKKDYLKDTKEKRENIELKRAEREKKRVKNERIDKIIETKNKH